MRSPVVKDIEKVVEIMRVSGELTPYYEYGHRLEIANMLTEKEKTQYKYNRYPLIALRLDILERDTSKGMMEYRLNMAIMTMTDHNYNSKQRYDKVFIPVLYPLYERFFKALKKSGIFTWPGHQEKPEHAPIDRLYWGTQFSEGNVKNIFNDPIDAIELLDLKLNKRIKC